MKRLAGKVALIPGTARGQGRTAALRFAAEGAIVGGGDLRHESELKAQRLVAQAGGTALTPGPLDATDEDSVRAWVEEAADAFSVRSTSEVTGPSTHNSASASSNSSSRRAVRHSYNSARKRDTSANASCRTSGHTTLMTTAFGWFSS
ncbi:hypothetical protein BIV23_39540 [Streptomyces monashensis]|uniref:Uncharacterized protein n=1 Tax=Streptomyces monashensis TaxID=1678012 RepID=A0A1S2PCL6_9ACTN|nr:hypothetical protein BIV23_39540 [Streptomyces monashensis]